jgi:hypothetical protein
MLTLDTIHVTFFVVHIAYLAKDTPEIHWIDLRPDRLRWLSWLLIVVKL